VFADPLELDELELDELEELAPPPVPEDEDEDELDVVPPLVSLLEQAAMAAAPAMRTTASR
jgi:hypothetical protein